MNQAHLTDRIPDVVHGAAEWTVAEQAHFADCPACRREWRLVSMVATAAPPAPAVDVAEVATRVLTRLRGDVPVIALDSRHRWRRAAIGLAAAASLALTLGLWHPWEGRPELAVAPTRQPTMLPELDRLFESELEVVLASIEPEPIDPLGSVPRIGDLSDTELEVLLEQVEGS